MKKKRFGGAEESVSGAQCIDRTEGGGGLFFVHFGGLSEGALSHLIALVSTFDLIS